MQQIISGCKDCPFYVDTRDLNNCYHPSVNDTYEVNKLYPRIGKDVFEDVFRQGKMHPDWCPLNKEPLIITKPTNTKTQTYMTIKPDENEQWRYM